MNLSRRDFLKAAGATTGGFVILPSLLDGGLKAFAAAPPENNPEGGFCWFGCEIQGR